MPNNEMPSDSPIEVPPLNEQSVTSSNDTLPTVPSVCARCGNPATKFCPHCGQDFCDTHQCIMHSQEFQVESHPIIDEDGTRHAGRSLRLIGEGWPNKLRSIKDLTDEQLVEQIKFYQKMLEESVRTADYARICIAHAEFDLSYRENSRYVAAMKRREKIEQGAIRLGGKKYRKDTQQAPGVPLHIASLMKAHNISQAQAEALVKLLSASKGGTT
jgi:hypothetical protein